MCGIVGMISVQGKTVQKTLESLKRLEYRGYDSSGIALFDKNGWEDFRAVGKIVEMEKLLSAEKDAKIAIAHTRWATHGKPTVENSHPHHSESGRICLVHNGTIENYLELKEKYCSDVNFYGQTDTEVIANVLAKFIEKDGLFFQEALLKLLQEIDGGYAFVIIDTKKPKQMYFAKNKSPLIIGKNPEECFVASDLLAIDPYVEKFIEIDDLTFGEIANDCVAIWDMNGNKIEKNFETYTLNQERVVDKTGFEHFMLKEIYEQPAVLQKLSEQYVQGEEFLFDKALVEHVLAAPRLAIIAAGTSYHAGIVVANLFTKLLHKSVDVYVASEFTYGEDIIDKDVVYFFFSQSGETADSRAALQKVKKVGPTTVTLTNVVGSTLSRECDYTLAIFAGVEIAVASTKAYVAQIATMVGMLYKCIGKTTADYRKVLTTNAQAIEKMLESKSIFEKYAYDNLVETRSAFYIGRQVGYALSVEAALKLKEISYIQTEGFAAGELKHGTIALIEEGIPVIAFVTDEKTAGMTRSNIEEVKARGAHVFVVANSKYARNDDDVQMEVDDETAAISMIVPAQLIAYYAAIARGCDVDMPRNLAKSVTVE
jgi:glucosamine--fructose-6-phosphate aminotransferase (isomerizing)